MGKGVDVLWCVNPGKPVEVESIHFNAELFTADEARAWLKKHDYSTADFAEATDPRVKAIAAEAAAEEIRGGCGTLELLAQADGHQGPRRVKLLAYTGVPMKLPGFFHSVVVDLDTLKVPRQTLPILRNHKPGKIAGHSVAVEKSAQRLKAEGILSGQPDNTDDVVATAGRGFPWQVSIGAANTRKMQFVPEGESEKVNGRNWPGPVLVARGAVLRELSIVTMGADGDTEASLAAEFTPDLLCFVHNSELSPNEPDWAAVDKAALPMLAFADHGDGAGKKSTWGFPHHFVADPGGKDDMGCYTTGTMYLHKGGLDAAWSAANGGRSGQKASQAVIDHLMAHRKALGLDKEN